MSAAQSAAESWLGLVDQGRYDESWSTAATLFRKVIDSAGWSKAVGSVRGQIGKLRSRQLQSAEYKTSLPGAPDGKYVVIVFNSSFEHKASAVETVTPSQDPDGTWHVSGYFVK